MSDAYFSQSVRLADGSLRLLEITPVNLQYAEKNWQALLEKFQAVGISFKGFSRTSTDFLDRFSSIEVLRFVGCERLQVSHLEHFSNLKSLYLADTGRRNIVDLGENHQLESLYCEWGVGATGMSGLSALGSAKLAGLSIQSIEELGLPSGLMSLSISSSRVATVDGLTQLKNLSALGLHFLRDAIDLTMISGARHLQKLELERINASESIQYLGACRSLKELYLLRCGRISTLKWMADLNQLEAVSLFGISVDDADLSPLLALKSLKWVDFKFNKKMTHSLRDVRHHLGI